MDKIINLSIICKEFLSKKLKIYRSLPSLLKGKEKLQVHPFVKTLIPGNMMDGYCSIETMCQLLDEDSIDITKQGVDFRFTKSAVEFMQAMYQECLGLFRNKLQLDCKILEQFNSVKLLDSNCISLPSNMQDIYKGCGGIVK